MLIFSLFGRMRHQLPNCRCDRVDPQPDICQHGQEPPRRHKKAVSTNSFSLTSVLLFQVSSGAAILLNRDLTQRWLESRKFCGRIIFVSTLFDFSIHPASSTVSDDDDYHYSLKFSASGSSSPESRRSLAPSRNFGTCHFSWQNCC